MANTLSPYNPTFYAAEALILLQNALGMANRVYRGYEAERKGYNLGETVQVRKPSDFSVTSAPSSSTNDPYTTSQTITINQWNQVKFALTDKELTQSGSRVIEEHIQPAAYALANQVDTDLMSEYVNIPWYVGCSSTPTAVADITLPRKVLVDNAGKQVDMDDGKIHCAVSPNFEQNLLASTHFHSATLVGGTANQDALMKGHLGTRFGIEFFRSHNVQQHASGSAINGGDVTGLTLSAEGSQGATTIGLSNGTGTETLKAGDSFVIAGNSQRYVVTDATNTAGSGTYSNVGIFPALVTTYSSGANVTFAISTTESHATDRDDNTDAFYANMLFHENAFGLVVVPLPEIGDGAGANMSTVTDDQTGLSIRSRMAYDDDNAKVKVTLDILYGVKTLEPNLAVRIQENV
jgi:hypothetical protein